MSIVKLLNLVDKGKLMEAIGNDESELWTVKGIRAVIEEQPVLMRIPETDIRVRDLIRRKDAIELCLEALNNMPSAEMESVVRTLDADHAVINGREYISLSRVNEMLAEEKAKRESVPVSVGEWIEDTLQLTNGLSGYTVFRCNICGNVMIHKSKYCPACGCYMEK